MSLLFRLALLVAMTSSALCSLPTTADSSAGLIDLAEGSAVLVASTDGEPATSAEEPAGSTHEGNGKIELLPAASSSLPVAGTRRRLPLECCQLIPEFLPAGFAANLHTCEAQLESQARRAFATQPETDTPDVRVFFLQRDKNGGAGYTAFVIEVEGRKTLDITHVDAEGKSNEIIGQKKDIDHIQ